MQFGFLSGFVVKVSVGVCELLSLAFNLESACFDYKLLFIVIDSCMVSLVV